MTTTSDWRTDALAATRGTQFGAIIHEALRCQSQLPEGAETDLDPPRFIGRASTTSDGFLMCDFINHDGDHHLGAFVGSVSDLDGNVAGLVKHLGLDATQTAAFRAVMKGWVR